ncbi:MAG: endonuclease/exonuclease/phosphatase family protein [Prevotella sp.]|jgi:endonuclease/exonuclease/phosphatase family metal-dependent hydrolase|nr:endonuclease/exonuclease/phosphatase family protein [Prevotella sp.]
MGKLAVYKYLSFMMLVVTILVAVFIIMGIFGGYANPATGTALALTVFALPLFIIADVLLLLFWLIRRRWHWAAIPGVMLLCCIPYIGTIFQPGLFRSSGEAKSGLNVATYNVAMFGREMNGYKSGDILTMMKNNEVDILCLQEYMEQSGEMNNSENYLKYFSSMAKGQPDMVIFSRRYPIIDSQAIDFGHTGNSAMWADVDVNGRVFRIFNVHLETTGINSALHQAAKQEARGQLVERNSLLRAIYGSYTRGMAIRAQQADLVASEIEKSPHPVILCGDFNDVPYSYVYRKMKGDLVDGFKESGKGFMYTMRDGKKLVRIDYIFHNDELEGYNYRTINVTYSDHLPVLMRIGL